MSKRTSYSKIYRPDVRFVRTSACVRVYPADLFFPADGFLPSAPTIKKRVRTDGLMRSRGHAHASAPPYPSPSPTIKKTHLRRRADATTRTCPCVRMDSSASALPYPSPSPSPCIPSLALCGQADAFARTRMLEKKF
jgi:hypothetical protein